ncbi:MAG: hypothetical protein M1825_005397 [Sarcosagium campestre]|nr:MAG: hypothetical protein M1825_005397 [Sarcosagium campestre]
MPVGGLKVLSRSRNGVEAFIPPCKRLDFHYNDWAGSSVGMNTFLRHKFAEIAALNPKIEMSVSPRPGITHPIIRASYVNGREKVVCVRNLSASGVREKAELLMAANGEKLKKGAGKVTPGASESVRGVWSPFHNPGGPKRVL